MCSQLSQQQVHNYSPTRGRSLTPGREWGGGVLPWVEEFKYPRVLFTSEGTMERELDRWIWSTGPLRTILALRLPVDLRSIPLLWSWATQQDWGTSGQTNGWGAQTSRGTQSHCSPISKGANRGSWANWSPVASQGRCSGCVPARTHSRDDTTGLWTPQVSNGRARGRGRGEKSWFRCWSCCHSDPHRDEWKKTDKVIQKQIEQLILHYWRGQGFWNLMSSG